MRLKLKRRYDLLLPISKYLTRVIVEPPFMENQGQFKETHTKLSFTAYKLLYRNCFREWDNSMRLYPKKRTRMSMYMNHYIEHDMGKEGVKLRRRKVLVRHAMPKDIDRFVQRKLKRFLPKQLVDYVMEFLLIDPTTRTRFQVEFDKPKHGLLPSYNVCNMDKILHREYVISKRYEYLDLAPLRSSCVRELKFVLFADDIPVSNERWRVDGITEKTSKREAEFSHVLQAADLTSYQNRNHIALPRLVVEDVPEYEESLTLCLTVRMMVTQSSNFDLSVTMERRV